MARAYLHAAPVLGKPEIGEPPLQTLSRLFEQRFDVKKGLRPCRDGGRTSVYMGYCRITFSLVKRCLRRLARQGSPRFLQNAETLAEVSRQLLQDPVNGGFFDHPRISDHIGSSEGTHETGDGKLSSRDVVSESFSCHREASSIAQLPRRHCNPW